jgi:hypothetical protein
MKHLDDIVPLTAEEMQTLRAKTSSSIKWTAIIFPALAVLGYLILKDLDRDMRFITYFVVAFYFIIIIISIYGIYASLQDARVGTKTIYQDVIIEKKHTITHSSSGTGNSRTTTTNHYYSFLLKERKPLSVSEARYNAFKQEDTIQVETLTYSKSLWQIYLVTATQELLLPTNLPTHTQAVETAYQPFEASEIQFLQNTKQRKILWRVLYMIPQASFIFILISFVNGLWLRYGQQYGWAGEATVALVLSTLWCFRSITRLQALYGQDLHEGKFISLLTLIDKEIVNSGGNVYIAHFDQQMRLPISEKIYQALDVHQPYWVGKTVKSKHFLSLQTMDKKTIWNLFA